MKLSRKPLINWCRWHECTLRIMGKDGAILLGEVVHHYDGKSDPFRYDPTTWTLAVGDKTVQLDEMGVEQ